MSCENMSCENIVINGVEYVKKTKLSERDDMPYVVVRCRDAGVHAGFLKSEDRENNCVELVNSRRLWRYYARTLSGMALEGPFKLDQCKFGDELPLITLFGWCEIIPCTEEAMNKIMSVEIWEND